MEKSQCYEFSQFRLDTNNRLLYRGNEIVALTPKNFDLLALLVENQGRLIVYDELKKTVWKESRFVEDKTLTQAIYTLRLLLGDNSSQQKYIENVPKRGYRFAAEITSVHSEDHTGQRTEEIPPEENPAEELNPNPRGRGGLSKSAFAFAGLLLCGLGIGIFWWIKSAENSPAASQFIENIVRSEVRSPSDQEAITQLIGESQKYESLILYVSPQSFSEADLPQYWLPPEQGGKEILKVRSSLKRLQEKNLRYGDESRTERFEFRYVRVFSPRDYAEAGTVERWYLPLYRADGSRVEGRNEYLGPYEVDYALRKVDGRWMIEETSTPRFEEKK
jgi:DNA-binding winged helix-turn-helix (wHTH) protein